MAIASRIFNVKKQLDGICRHKKWYEKVGEMYAAGNCAHPGLVLFQ